MAAAVKGLAFSTQCISCRAKLGTQSLFLAGARKSFSTSCPLASSRRAGGQTIRRKEKDLGDEGAIDTAPPLEMLSFRKALTPSEKKIYLSLSKEDRKRYKEEYKRIGNHLTSPRVLAGITYDFDQVIASSTPKGKKKKSQSQPFVPGLMAMNQDDERGNGSDEDPFDDRDDMPSLAHEQLHEEKDIRHYARIAAWEMPMLHKLAKPFELPGKDQILRFRHTSYMGDQHPAERKVVVQFSVDDVPDMSQQQREKLIKLAGPRYDPESTLVKMSCDSFESQAQNKRYLGDLIDKLLVEAKDSTDTFSDVPFDFRHHTYSHEPEFPESWRMTTARKKQLDDKRQQKALAEAKLLEHGNLVSGKDTIAASYDAPPGSEYQENMLEAHLRSRGSDSDRTRLRR